MYKIGISCCFASATLALLNIRKFGVKCYFASVIMALLRHLDTSTGMTDSRFKEQRLGPGAGAVAQAARHLPCLY